MLGKYLLYSVISSAFFQPPPSPPYNCAGVLLDIFTGSFVSIMSYLLFQDTVTLVTVCTGLRV